MQNNLGIAVAGALKRQKHFVF